MPTRRGWSLLGAAIGLYAGARILGLAQLAVLAATGFALLGGALVWTRRRVIDVRAARTLPERLQVGGEGRVDLLLTAGPRRTPTLTVSDRFDRGRRTARFVVAPLAPGASARAAYRVPTRRRGRYELGPLSCGLADPFGLARRSWPVAGAEDVIVHPRVHDVLGPPQSGGDDVDSDAPRVRGRREPGGEFVTLREYVVGDDLRRVHWRSTARRDVLMLRQEEARRRAPVSVLLDVRPGAHDRASFETAVEAVASIVTALEREGRPAEVLTSAGEPVGRPGRRHLAIVMDELAIVEPHGPDRIVPHLATRRIASLVAVMGRLRPDDLGLLGIVVRGHGLLAIVATRPHGALTSLPPRPGLLVAAIPPGRAFPTAWNDAVLRWHHGNEHRQASHSPS